MICREKFGGYRIIIYLCSEYNKITIMGSLKSHIGRNEATVKSSQIESREQLRKDLYDSLHVVSSEELKSRRNPLYTYMM